MYVGRHKHAAGRELSPTYTSWAGMTQRCTNPKATGYSRYGGRGITVCERWKSFDNFLADMGERPKGMTLDREDNSQGYEPSNCRWATPRQQTSNTRRSKFNAETAAEALTLFTQGWSNAMVAAKYGCARSTVGFLRTGRTWKELSRS